MSNDPVANMASLLALCDDLCETESATVDRRQLCEWLSAMRAQAHDIERLRRDSDRHNAEWHDKVKENAANYHYRLAAEARATAAEADAAASRRHMRAALVERDQTFKVMHDRLTAAEAERDALREAQSTALSLLGEIIRECNNTGLPNEIVADRVIERVEEWAMEARAALGGQP